MNLKSSPRKDIYISVRYSHCGIWSKHLSLGHANKLVVTGMTNVTIKCVAEFPMIQFTSAHNIKISNLRFQDCRDIQVGTKSKNVTFEITSSRLTCSCLRFKFDHTRSKWDALAIKIRSTTFDNCTCSYRSILSFRVEDIELNITLWEINVLDNNLPLLSLHTSQTHNSLIKFVGSSTFHHNKNFVVYVVNSRLLFKGAVVDFISNTVHVLSLIHI